jgi:hypothetical protein
MLRVAACVVCYSCCSSSAVSCSVVWVHVALYYCGVYMEYIVLRDVRV